MKFVHRASQRLQTLMDSDLASWVLILAVTAASIAVSIVLLSTPSPLSDLTSYGYSRQKLNRGYNDGR